MERVTGVPARLWNNLEANYREQLARINEKKQLQRELDWLKGILIKQLIERGAIEKQADKAALLQDVFRFFGVTSVDA